MTRLIPSIDVYNGFENITLSTDDVELAYSRPHIISNRSMLYINIYLYFTLGGILALFGLINNVVNLIVFYKIGLKDSMSVGLMGLSLTDLLVSLFGLARVVFYVWDMALPNHPIRLVSVNQVALGWLRDSLFLCSSWITALLSIERCVCVVLPFKVKDIFTKVRAMVAVSVIYVVNVGVYIPVFLSGWLGWTKVEIDTNNGTVLRHRLVAQVSDSMPVVLFYVDIFTGAVIPMPAQAIVLISVVWMIYGLKTSSKIRRLNNISDNADKRESNLSSKERRLLQVVLFIAITLTLCNIPRFIAVYAKQIFPQVYYRGSYKNVYILLWTLTNLASTINASVNIFVYLTINTSYRQKFSETFCRNNNVDK